MRVLLWLKVLIGVISIQVFLSFSAVALEVPRKGIAVRIVEETGIGLQSVFGAVNGRDKDSLVKLMSYFGRRGFKPVRASIQSRIREAEKYCDDVKTRDRCEDEKSAAQGELVRIDELEKLSRGGKSEDLRTKALLAAIVFRDQVSQEITVPEYGRMKGFCAGKDSSKECIDWKEQILVSDELAELVFRIALARQDKAQGEREAQPLIKRFEAVHAKMASAVLNGEVK